MNACERYQPPQEQLKGDWFDPKSGEVYDGCSPGSTEFFDRQLDNGGYEASLVKHVNHANIDHVVVDTTGLGLTPDQQAKLDSVLDRLSPTQQAKILRVK